MLLDFKIYNSALGSCLVLLSGHTEHLYSSSSTGFSWAVWDLLSTFGNSDTTLFLPWYSGRFVRGHIFQEFL